MLMVMLPLSSFLVACGATPGEEANGVMFDSQKYDEETGKFVMDRKLSQELTSQAVEKGSVLAKLRRNKDLFFGTTEVSADRDSAIAEAERESSAIFSESILWTEQLGWFYEIEDEREKAIKAYEKCIINGYYAPIYDLALMYLEDGDEGYYKTLMKVGMELEVPDCRILGMENEYRWESLSGDERLDVYRQLNRNLSEGIEQGSGVCAYILADALLNGKFGFDIDLDRGKTYADLALTYGFSSGASLVIDAAEALQDPEFISDDDLLKLRYDALRYGNRLIMLHNGNIIIDVSGEEKARLDVPDLLKMFEQASGDALASDRMLLT